MLGKFHDVKFEIQEKYTISLDALYWFIMSRHEPE